MFLALKKCWKMENLDLIVENSEKGIYIGMKQALTDAKSFELYQQKLNNYKMPFNLKNSVKSITDIIDNL